MLTAQLNSELNQDPLTLGYAPLIISGNDIGLCALLNAKNFNGKKSLPSTELLAWAAGNGRMVKIELGATMTLPASTDPSYAQSVGVKSVAMAADRMINRDGTSLDLNLSDRQQLVGTLVAAGIISQADSDSLYALASTKVSRAEVLWGNGIVIGQADISLALRGY